MSVGPRVVHPDLRAAQLQGRGDVEGGGVAHVVAVGLEGAAEHGDVAAEQRSAEHLAGQLDGALPAAHVDLVDLAQEALDPGDAELAGAVP